MAPRYERPAAPIATQWPSGTGLVSTTTVQQPSATAIGWKDVFQSPQLQGLIQSALENNRDLRVATLNVKAAQASYRVQRSSLLPSVNATAGGTRQRSSENSRVAGQPAITSAYNGNLTIPAYELDLFGRLQSLSARSFNQYLATEQGQKAAQTALVAEVANAYLTYLADSELLQLTEDTLKTQEDSYAVIKQGYDMGAKSKLDLAQSATQVETARSNRAQYQRQVEQDKNALTLLVGKEIDPETLKPAPLNSVQVMEVLPANLPSTVLLDRPDVQQAEYTLKAENANIGAARAAFFPSITLTGSAGFASDKLSNLFTSNSSGAWSFAPQVNLPIFQGGSLWANLSLSKTNKEIAVAQYEKAIQTAFREVSDGLVARKTYAEQMEAQKALVKASEDTYEIAKVRYAQGVDSHLTLLDAQRSFYAARQNEIMTRQQTLESLVNLYKALGGGVL
jgi:multidrug efflux system outer membrane protein